MASLAVMRPRKLLRVPTIASGWRGAPTTMAVLLIIVLASVVSACHQDLRVQWVEGGYARFREHGFSMKCAMSYECKVVYAGFPHREGSGATLLGPVVDDLSRVGRGGHVGIRNFPGPALVVWRASDGKERHGRIDIGAIFKDEVQRHRVPLTDVAGIQGTPVILLVVDDRTIRVYMKTWVRLKRPVNDGNPYSDFREDVTLAFEKTYR